MVAAHCATEDRPFEAIEKTVSTRLEPGEPAATFVERAAALAALGRDHLVVLTRGPWTAEAIAVLAGAVPDLDAIPAATPALRHDHQEHRP